MVRSDKNNWDKLYTLQQLSVAIENPRSTKSWEGHGQKWSSFRQAMFDYQNASFNLRHQQNQNCPKNDQLWFISNIFTLQNKAHVQVQKVH